MKHAHQIAHKHAWKRWRTLPLLFAIAITFTIVATVSAAVAITATKSYTIIGDDGDGKADPGETIEYSVAVTNNGSTDATGVALNDTIDANTTLVGGSIAASPVAVNDTLPVIVTGNVAINTLNMASPFSVVANDFQGQNMSPGLTISAYDSISAQGGQVSMITSGANIGTFTYNPPTGYEGNDTFTYTLSDNTNASGAAASRTATVSISISGMIWFVNNTATSCTANGCGRLSNPYSTLAAFNAVNDGTDAGFTHHPAANDNIFIYESASAYTGGITLLSGQKLIGQDSSQTLSAITGLSPVQGSLALPAMNVGAPAAVIQNAGGNGVTLNSGNMLNGFTASNSSGSAISGSGFGTLTVADVIVNTTGQALSLTNGTLSATFASVASSGGTNNIALAKGAGVLAGTLTINAGALSGAIGNAFDINGGTATIAYAGTIASGSARSVNVTGLTGGAVTFNGAITDTDTGINLASNTGATITFAGGLSLSTAASTAFNATGGGTINATQNNTSIVNTLTTTTGTALNVANTTIGASGLTFRSVSSNGAASGIILNTTGASGGLTITGNGGTCTSAGTCTGGAIQNSTSDGVVLTNTQSPSFTRLNVTDSVGAATDDGIVMTNVTGSVTVDSSSIINSPHNGITLDNNNTNLTGFSFTNSTITCASGQPCQPSGTIGNDGLLLAIRGTSVLASASISGSSFSGVRAVGVQVQTNDSGRIGANSGGTITAPAASNSVVIQSNTFTGNGQGIDVDQSQISNLTFQILSNTINGISTAAGGNGSSTAINVFSAAGADTGPTSHTMVGKVDGNIIGTQGVKDSGAGFGNGIRVVIQGQNTQGNVTVSNNTIRETAIASPLNFVAQNGAATTGTATAKFKIINNSLPLPSGTNVDVCGTNTPCIDAGIYILADEGTPVCNIITGNSVFDATAMNGGADIYLAERTGPPAGAQLTVEGTGGSNATYIQANNTLAGASAFLDESGTTSQVAPGGCGTFVASAPSDIQTLAQYAPEDNRLAASFAANSDTNPASDFAPAYDLGSMYQTVAWTAPSEQSASAATLSAGPAVALVASDAADRKAGLFAPLAAPALSGETLNVPIGTLPAGKSVTIKFRVTVNNPLSLGATRILNQSTISGSNFSNVTTTDPSPSTDAACTAAPAIGTQTCTPIDRPDTTVVSLTRQSANPTKQATVTWQVVFADPVDGLTASNFTLVPGGSVAGASITGVGPVGTAPDTKWNVTASTGTGDGSLGLNLANDLGLSHDVTNAPFTGEVYTIDKTAPTVTNVTSSSNTGCLLNFITSYCNASDSISIQVTFSEPVNVDTTGGTPTLTLNSGTAASYASGSGTDTLTFNYTVQAGDTSTDLDYTSSSSLVLNGGVITDAATNPATLTLAAPGAAGSLGTNTAIVIDTTAPTVTSFTRFNPATSPTNADTLTFRVLFSEHMVGIGNSDFAVNGTTTATVSSVAIINSNGLYEVTVDGGDLASFNGVVGLNFSGSAAMTDLAGNALVVAEPATDETYTVDNTAPSVTINQAAGQSDPTNSSSINFTVIFSEPVTGFATGDVSLGGTAGATTGTVTEIAPNDGTTYNVAASGMTGAGTVIASIPPGVAQDEAGNGNSIATSTDNQVTYIPPTDLSITKTDGVTTAVPGGSVTYTITASNSGPNSDPAATVADTFPASLTATWTCVGAGGGTCTASGSGNINDLVNLPAGGSVTYTASATVSAAASGTLANTATVSSSISDTNPANNSATDSDTLSAQADVSITKTDGVTTAVPGGSVTYTITASNAGPSNVSGATVADTFPASLTATWTCVGAGGGTCTASGSGNISDIVNLPAGGSVTYTASATISAAASGTLANTATVAAPGGVTDPVPGNNSATDSDTLSAQADVSITKTDGVTTAVAGGSVTYTITASNAGPSNVSGATVADTFPASLTATWTCVGAGGGTCTASGSGNISDIVNLPAGGSVTYTASATISAAASGTLANTATVAAPGGVTDPVPGNNSATDTDTVTPAVSVTINQASGQADPTKVSPINFTVVFAAPVTNFGDPTDVALGGTAGATTATITGGPSIYNVAVSGMTGDGSVTATIAAGVATGSQGEPNAASTSADNTVFYDISAPDTTINPPLPANPTNSTSASFSFSGDDATGSGVASFECQLDGGGFSACSSPQAYSGLSDASHTFEVRAIDAVGNTDASPAVFTWVVDTTAPTVVVSSVTASPTNTSPIVVTITFNEPVTGFTAATAAGDLIITNGTDSNPAGSGTTYTFDLTPSGQGPVTVVVPAGSATDAASNPNAVSNTFSITYDTISPTVTINQAAGQADPTGAAPIDFTVVFDEPVTSFTPADVTLGGTAPGSLGAIVSGGPITYTVAVSGMTGSGSVTADIAAGAVTDLAGNPSAASTSTDNTVTFDPVVPVVSGIVRADPSPTAAATVNYTVTFAKSVSGVDASDFSFTTSGVTSAAVSAVTGSGTTWTVTVNTGSGDGTLRLDLIDDDTIVDGAGNPLGGKGAGNGNFTGGEVYTIDKTGPGVASIARANASPSNTSAVDFMITFTEIVTGVDATDFSIVTSGITGAAITNVTGSGTTWTVTVGTGTGSGTIGLNLVDNDSIVDAVSNPLGGVGAGNGNFTGAVYTIDRIAPQAGNLVAANITTGGGAAQPFTIVVSDNLAIDIASLDGSDIRVSGPGGFSQLATLVSVTPATNGTPRTIAYQISAPGGAWDPADNGTYTVALQANQVNDTAGNSAAAGVLGTFNVNVANAQRRVYLPLMLHSVAQAPDLVISSVTLSPNKTSFTTSEPVQISVVIKNQGNAPTTPFWVDLYLNPSRTPALNLIWSQLCSLRPCYGIAWQVTQPLAPGAEITLTSTVSSYAPSYTNWRERLAAGTTDLYVQADSWNPGKAVGASGDNNLANNLFHLSGLHVTGQNLAGAAVDAAIPARP